MATKFYLTGQSAAYTPATIRGAWDDTAGAVTRRLHSEKIAGDNITNVVIAETTASNNHDVLLYRGVSGKLSTQTLSGTIDVLIGMSESNSAADMFWHIHVYVTQGDSDTPRLTLVNDYIGLTELTTTNNGKTLGASQTISGSITQGDRLVVELGYRSMNVVTTSRHSTLWYGTDTSTSRGNAIPDMTAGAAADSNAGFISFSNDVQEYSGDTELRVSQLTSKVLYDNTSSLRLSQTTSKVMYDKPVDVRLSQVVVKVLRSVSGTPISTDDETFFMGAWL